MTRPANLQPVLTFDAVSKVYCDDLLRSSRYALIDMLFPWRLRARARPTLRRSEFLALDEVSFSIAPGEVVGVIGGRRSGKSTLASVAGGLLQAQSGTVGRRGTVALINGLTAGMRPMLTLRENASFRAALYGVAESEIAGIVAAALELAAATAAADRVIFNLDPLQVRNVGLGLALALRPDLLVFDDALPLRGLPDPDAGEARLMEALAGRAALLVSGNEKLLERFATRCLVLAQGRIVFDGNVAAAFDALYRLDGALSAGLPAITLDDDDNDDDDESGGDEDDDGAPLDGEAQAERLQEKRERTLQKRSSRVERTARIQSRAQLLDVKAKSIMPGNAVFEPQEVTVAGASQSGPKADLIARSGETLSFAASYQVQQPTKVDAVELALYAYGQTEPFAREALPVNPTVLAQGDSYRVEGTFTLPDLQDQRYVLALHFPDESGEVLRSNTVRLAIVGLYGGTKGFGPRLRTRGA